MALVTAMSQSDREAADAIMHSADLPTTAATLAGMLVMVLRGIGMDPAEHMQALQREWLSMGGAGG